MQQVQTPPTNMLPSSQIPWKEKIRQSGVFDAILMTLLKDIHKVFVAQMQKKIKQWEIGSLSPFWDFLHSILPLKCVGSLPAPLQAASAGFQTGSNALCLVYCWFPLPYIWLPNLLPSEEYSDRCREKKCRYPTLYPVVGCHVIRPLKTGILVKKKKKKAPFSFPFSQFYFIFYIQPLQILAGLPCKQYFGCILHRFTQKLITPEQRLAAVLIVTVWFHPFPRLTTQSLHVECKQKTLAIPFCSLVFPSIVAPPVLGGWDTSKFSLMGW